MYRSAAASLPARVKSKLTGRETWFKGKKTRKLDEFDRKTDKTSRKRKKETEEANEERIVGVLFVPYTPDSKLARRYRET